MFSNKTYDILRWVASLVLPAAGTLYFAISNIWGLPYGEQVVGTITAIDAFLGVILGISNAKYVKSENYGDGTMEIDQTNPDKDKYRLVIRTALDDLKDKDVMHLKVNSNANLSDAQVYKNPNRAMEVSKS